MLLLMFAFLTTLIAGFCNFNSSTQQQMETETDRSREQIVISQICVSTEKTVSSIVVSNTGAEDVVIRAIYREVDGSVSFLLDPSVAIAQGESANIDLAGLGYTVYQGAFFFAATENGVKSKGVNELQFEYDEPPSGLDTSGLSVGPLLLTFDSLSWSSCDKKAKVFDGWQQIYTIPTGGYSGWRVDLTNIDTENRSLTINRYSGFTLSKVGSPSTTTWYLKDAQVIVGWNQTMPIVFVWDSSYSAAQSVSASQKGVNNVFLTIMGEYEDGEPFAQTIPFEAVTVE